MTCAHCLRKRSGPGLLLAAALGLLIAPAQPAEAQTLTVLYSFTGGADEAYPYGTLVKDKAGNLYGTTSGDDLGPCPGSCGTVFKVASNGTETVLYSFAGFADGSYPNAGVVFDAKGNLYGTTHSGGAYGSGTVFELTPSAGGWHKTVLHSFNYPDGAGPIAGVLLGKNGVLYGTTQMGGGANGVGTVFEIRPSASGWIERVLHSFCGSDGAFPVAGLIMDKEGNLYGTTSGGGAYDGSVVFELTPSGVETVLYNFCSAAGCADGSWPPRASSTASHACRSFA